MNQPRIPQSILAAIPKSREVISMNGGVEARGRWCLLKCLLRDRTTEVVIMPPAVAFHISRSVGTAIVQVRYRDIRRRKDDPRPEFPEIRTFLDCQPDVEQGDWDANDGARIAKGCEVRAFKDAVFLAFNVGSGDIHKILPMAPAISFYLVDMIEKIRRDGAVVDIDAAVPPIDHKQ